MRIRTGPVVADGVERVERLLVVGVDEHVLVVGRVHPHASEAVRDQLLVLAVRRPVGACWVGRLELDEHLVLHMVTKLVCRDDGSSEITNAGRRGLKDVALPHLLECGLRQHDDALVLHTVASGQYIARAVERVSEAGVENGLTAQVTSRGVGLTGIDHLVAHHWLGKAVGCEPRGPHAVDVVDHVRQVVLNRVVRTRLGSGVVASSLYRLSADTVQQVGCADRNIGDVLLGNWSSACGVIVVAATAECQTGSQQQRNKGAIHPVSPQSLGTSLSAR